MGLEPTRCSQHKILSLARLPIPTLPHALPKRKMQEMGLEPTLCCHNRHLKPARLPFRHSCATDEIFNPDPVKSYASEKHSSLQYPESGTDGDRTHDLPHVKRTLIPAELRFHIS